MAGKDVVNRPVQLRSAVREDDQTVADALEVGDDVRREHDADAGLGDRLDDGVQKLAPRQRVERGDGLVEQQQLRSFGQREGQRNLGLLSARERPEWLVERKTELVDASRCERVVPVRIQLSSQPQRLADPETAWEGMVLSDEAHTRQYQLRLGAWIVSEHGDAAGAGLEQSNRELQKRRLAGTVRPDERRHRSRRDLELAVAQRPGRAVSLTEPLCTERCFGHATRETDAGRTMTASRAVMLSSSRPAARARSTQLWSDDRRSFTSPAA